MKEWLVRSSGEIKGPYQWDELTEAIYSQEVGLLDEVCKSTERWSYVRENPELRKIVARVRERIDQNLDSTQTNINHTQTITIADNEAQSEEQLEKTVITEAEVPVESEIVGIPQKPVNNSQKNSQPSKKKIAEVKNYSLRSDIQKQQASKQAFLQVVKWVFVICILTIGGFLGYEGLQQRHQNEIIEKHYTQMIRYAKFGLFSQAYDEYKQIKDKYQFSLEDNWLMIPAFLNYEVNTDKVKKIANQKLEQNPQDRETAFKVNLVYASVDQYLGEKEKAAQHLNQADASKPNSEITKLNLAALALRNRDFNFDFKESFETLPMVTDLEFLAWGIMHLSRKNTLDAKTQEEFLKIIKQKLMRDSFIKDRFLLLKSLWENKVDPEVWKEPILDKFEVKLDPFIFPDFLDPKVFDNLCSKAKDQAVHVLCSLVIGDLLEAEKKIEEWQKQQKQPLESLLARGHFLEKAENWKELRALAELTSLKGTEVSGYWKLKSCSHGIGSCDEEIKKWSAQEEMHIETLVALAHALKYQGRAKEAMAFYQKAVRILPERMDMQQIVIEGLGQQ